MKKIVFLYLYGLHHLYHTAMTAMALSSIKTDYEILCISCNDEHTKVLEKIKKNYPGNNVRIIQLKQPFRYKYLNFKKKTYPSVNKMMKFAKQYLLDVDCIITTSHGTPRMLKKNKIIKPKLIYKYHGCGDREYSFEPGLKNFDYMLLPGKYYQNRLIKEKIIEIEKTAIVGWPKFDFLHQNQKPLKLFNNNNRVVLYAPHWEPKLSSYNLYSEYILQYFSEHKEMNLIFAPHVLIKHWKTHLKYNINLGHYKQDNIIIDFGSNFSTDGTYINKSDVYIGDVSSMVYEFIALKNRPCLFLNAHHVKWENNINYRFWEFGPVVEQQKHFEQKLMESINSANYLEIQKCRIGEYLDLNEKSSSIRAAEAIVGFLENC